MAAMKRIGTEVIQPYDAMRGTVARADKSEVARGLYWSESEPAHRAIISMGNANPVKDRETTIVEAPKLSICGAQRGSNTPIE